MSRSPKAAIPVSVRGEVRAYLVAAERFEELESGERSLHRRGPARIRGTLEILGDLDEGSRWAAEELERAALRRADKAGLRSKRS